MGVIKNVDVNTIICCHFVPLHRDMATLDNWHCSIIIHSLVHLDMPTHHK